jgi:hypothetical protein
MSYLTAGVLRMAGFHRFRSCRAGTAVMVFHLVLTC